MCMWMLIYFVHIPQYVTVPNPRKPKHQNTEKNRTANNSNNNNNEKEK